MVTNHINSANAMLQKNSVKRMAPIVLPVGTLIALWGVSLALGLIGIPARGAGVSSAIVPWQPRYGYGYGYGNSPVPMESAPPESTGGYGYHAPRSRPLVTPTRFPSKQFTGYGYGYNVTVPPPRPLAPYWYGYGYNPTIVPVPTSVRPRPPTHGYGYNFSGPRTPPVELGPVPYGYGYQRPTAAASPKLPPFEARQPIRRSVIRNFFSAFINFFSPKR